MTTFSSYSNIASATTFPGPCDLNIGPVTAADCHSATALVTWFKADAGIAVLDGQRIPQWSDQSGGAHHMTQGTGVDQAFYATTIPGGGPAVRFTTADEAYTLSGLAAVARVSYTFYFLLRYDPNQGHTGLIFSTSSANGGILIFADTGGNVKLQASHGGLAAYNIITPAHCGWQVLTFVLDDPNSLMSIYRNGVSLVSGAYNTDGNTDSTWGVPTSSAGFGLGLVWDAAEILIYSAAHTAGTIATASTCLRNRWNISAGQGV